RSPGGAASGRRRHLSSGRRCDTPGRADGAVSIRGGTAMSLWARIYAERRGVILPLAIAAAVNLAVLLLAVIPLARSVQGSESAAEDATLQLFRARQLADQAREAADSQVRAERELQQFYTGVLPRGFAVATTTTNRWLQQAAQ